VVARNWRSRSGEIDLIVRKDRLVVFCEVKTRTSERFGAPLEAVTPAKVRRLRRLAAEWLAAARTSEQRPLGPDMPDLDLRFDVASVMSRSGRHSIEVIESAF
jgi:putative endonuclease